MAFKDPEKRREYNRRFYAQNPEKQKLAVKQRYHALRRKFVEYKRQNPCRHCGESDPVCIEFHHIDPSTKETEPSQLLNTRGWSFERVVAHLESYCIPLCSNCHKKVHRDLRELAKKLNEPTARPPARKSRR